MDVLQVLKEGHDQGRHLSVRFSTSSRTEDRRRFAAELNHWMEVQFRLEEQYLYPEIATFISNSDKFLSQARKRQKTILAAMAKITEQMAALEKSPAAEEMEIRLRELTSQISQHLGLTDAEIIPQLRELIPTPDREDLGLLFLELKEEFSNELRSHGTRKETDAKSAKNKKRA